ncbi:LysE family transporter [Streptomyces sp. NPDC048172]|uniref:LysE family transporter n=1 Tax=Streptomyces sp. NPDC048172 TaxID=3365505 RepID=UPI003712BF2A
MTDSIMEAALTGLVAGYAVSIPVGALAVLLVSVAARTSFRVGAAGALGTATADGGYAAVAVLGGAAVAGAVEPVAVPLRWTAGAVLVLLAVKSGRTALAALRARRGGSGDGGGDQGDGEGGRGVALRTPSRAFLGFLGLTLLNPWAIIYFSALTLGRQDLGGTGTVSRLVFVAAIALASLSWQLLLAVGGVALGRALTGVRGRAVTSLVSSVVIAALAVVLVTGS